MRRRCGSMRGNAQSDDLEPRARCSGAPARQASGVATRQIRAQRCPDPPQSHQNCLGQFQGSQGAHGHPRLKQTTPLTGLSAPKSPLPCRRAPNVVRCVARPRRGHTVIERQRQIGRSENPQNW
ncbi:hypothetical protein BJV77DRAFT_1021894, partial [Russula vinacea]